jgi:hypothetical protein
MSTALVSSFFFIKKCNQLKTGKNAQGIIDRMLKSRRAYILKAVIERAHIILINKLALMGQGFA